MLVRGNHILLRDRIPSDLEIALKWLACGEHLKYDAPWENVDSSPDKINGFQNDFLEKCKAAPTEPCGSAIIAILDNYPIGTVNRYFPPKYSDACFIGLSIKDDRFLNQGLGTEALKLWVDYQFSLSDYNRIGLETWSFNPRAIQLARKIGFVHEGTLRELRLWAGSYIDKIIFGLLRREWEKQSANSQT